MNPFKLYIDEDATNRALVVALGSRGVNVLTALDAGLIGQPDDRQLAFAAERGSVLYTYNVSDFYRLHTEWIAAGRRHAGIILAAQRRFSLGEQLQRVLLIRAQVDARAMMNRVEFLANWVPRPNSS